MATSKIRKEDVIEDGILDEAIAEGEKYVKILEKQNVQLKENAKLHKEQAKTIEMTAKGVKDLEKVEKESLNTERQKIELDKEQARLEQELEKARKIKTQRVAAEIRLGQQQKKIRDRNAKAIKQESSAYTRLSKRLNEARKRYKDLLAEGRATEKQTIALGKEVQSLDRKLKSIDAQAGQFQRNVGNYPKTLGKVQTSFRNLIGVVGQFGVALGGVAITRNVVGVIQDFDQATANLKAISGATESQLESLTTQAKDLGSTTSFTASEVAGLQTELAKLGFNPTQIEQSTESILKFAKATGADLSQASALTGSALRAFGLDAREAERVTAVLGVSTTKTALDFEKLNSGLSTVAPVANAFGFTIEETTALLGQLSNAGFDASSSATATRNILLNLADANGDLAKALGGPIKSVEELGPALRKLSDELGEDGLAEALELTDKRSVAAFQTFLQGADDLQPLVKSLTDVEDELTKIAETQDNTLTGAFARLQSAWEGYILGADGATGASERLRDIIDFLAENLDTIIDLVLRLGRAFLTFRTALFLTQKVVRPLSRGFQQLSSGLKSTATGTKSAAGAFKSFNNVLRANLIGFVTVAIVELVDALDLFTSKAEKAQQVIDGIREAEAERRKQALEEQSDALTDFAKERRNELREIDRTIRAIQASNKTEKEKLDLIQEQIDKKKELFKQDIELIDLRKDDVRLEAERARIDASKTSLFSAADEDLANLQEVETRLKKFESLLARINRGEVKASIGGRSVTEQRLFAEEKITQLKQIQAKLQETNITEEKQLELLNAEQLKLAEELKDLEVETLEINADKRKNNKKSIKQKITEIDIEKERLKLAIREERNEKVKIDLNKQLLDLEAKRRFEKLLSEKRSKEELKAIMELYQTTLQLNEAERQRAQFNLFQERVKEIDERRMAIEDLEKAYEDLRLEFLTADSDKAIELVDREIAALRENINTREDLAKLNKLEDDRAALQIEQIERLRDAEVQAAKDKFDAEFKLLKLRQITLETRKNFGLATEQDLKELELLEKQIDQLEKNFDAEVAVITKRAENEIETVTNQAQENQLKNTEDFNKKLIEEYKQLADAIVGIFEAITEAISKQLDKQIERLDEQIAASKEKQDQLREIAINGRGDIAEDAKKSLAAEEAAQAQAEAKKAQAEKRKQQLEKISIILNNIGNLVEQGLSIPEATSRSVASFQIVESLIKGLAEFYEGTDDTGTVSKPLDNKGGRLAILHDNEQVWSKKDRAKVGNKSRAEVIEAANMGWDLAAKVGTHQSMLQHTDMGRPIKTEQAQLNVFDSSGIERKLSEVKAEIAAINIPGVEMGEITENIFEIIEKKSKNETIRHRIKVPKL